MKILTRILKNSCQDPWGSSKILKDPQFSCQDLWGSSKIFKDNLQILPRSLRILCGSYQDLWGSLMFLPKIFKGPLWILPRSLRIFKDPGKEIEDPQGSLRILCWFLPRSLRIFKDLHWSFAYLTKISEDLQGSSIFFGQDPWGSSKILKSSCQEREDPQFSWQDLWGSSGSFADQMLRSWGSWIFLRRSLRIIKDL